MATKEDILEQIVGEYLIHKGYFVRHNIKFRPLKTHPLFDKQKDSNHSDIDVIGYHPLKEGHEKVLVVSCKSWQGGFNPSVTVRDISDQKTKRGRAAWKAYRELTNEKWAEAFRHAVVAATGCSQFIYVTACAKVNGDKSAWEQNDSFRAALGGNPIRVITFREMVIEIQADLTTTLAATEVGRMLQMFLASDIRVR